MIVDRAPRKPPRGRGPFDAVRAWLQKLLGTTFRAPRLRRKGRKWAARRAHRKVRNRIAREHRRKNRGLSPGGRRR